MRTWVAVAALIALGACKDKDQETGTPAPEPGELMVGFSRVRMPVPVGIGTAGFGGFGVDAEPSPFADIYPATTRIHNHPDFRAIAITRGDGFEAILLRSDTVGVFQQFRRGVVLELQERLGRDLDDALIIGATHTHSGPGRVIDAEGPFTLIADVFLPEFYDNMVDAMADAVEQALADAKPGRIGWAFARDDEGANDRRCEDGGPDHVNGALPILAIEQEGELVAMALAYPVHGTLLGIEELTLSQDVSGGIEQGVEDRFDHPVQVQMHNAWGADMSPGNPVVPSQAGAAMPDGYDRMEQVGVELGDAVVAALDDIVWEDAPEILLRTQRVPIDREHIGYPDDVFQYDYGAVYCGSALEADCDASTTLPDLDDTCIPFNAEFPAPNQTEFTSGRIGNTYLTTFPGESGTALAERIVAGIQGYGEVGQVMFVGYAQDYLGYSIEEDDWWQGGYEAGGSLWGPRQGDYLADAAVQSFGETFGFVARDEEPAPIAAFGGYTVTPYSGPTPTDLGTVVQDVAGAYAGTDAIVLFEVGGADPWWGAPIAWLEHADGTAVTRPNGNPVHSDGRAFWVDLTVDPPYADGIDVPSRAFHWAFSMPLVHATVGADPGLAAGDYRLRVELPDGNGGTQDVTSATFSWSP